MPRITPSRRESIAAIGSAQAAPLPQRPQRDAQIAQDRWPPDVSDLRDRDWRRCLRSRSSARQATLRIDGKPAALAEVQDVVVMQVAVQHGRIAWFIEKAASLMGT